ncbi:RusA family crossover junction endodeoxyribonuclease [Marinitoga lauensis]|uniref:RusA family crossover junction endodeoxyribonuclease n=1 Tax=Marinitoga lauensis TaxID=2201189 RepID=UPI001404BC0C|nr:RusA family crossover junction endodeoxyribonuclease [Marinitoga lauensis]
MKLEIEIEGIPPSVNHAYRKRGRGHGLYKTPQAKEFQKRVYYIAREAMRKARWTMIPKDRNFYLMEMHFHFKNWRHPDPNNLLKILIDSFQGVVFEDDKNIDTKTKSFVDGKDKTIVIFYK